MHREVRLVQEECPRPVVRNEVRAFFRQSLGKKLAVPQLQPRAVPADRNTSAATRGRFPPHSHRGRDPAATLRFHRGATCPPPRSGSLSCAAPRQSSALPPATAARTAAAPAAMWAKASARESNPSDAVAPDTARSGCWARVGEHTGHAAYAFVKRTLSRAKRSRLG